MTIVKKTSSTLLVLFFLIIISSCNRPRKNKEESSTIVIDTIVYDYSNIETNRLNERYNGRLINTLPVKKNDTVLFRTDTLGNSKITIANKASKFEIETLNVLNYYKTGTNKFSTYPISIKNKKTKKVSTLYIYSNLGESERPAGPSNMSSLVNIKKINDTLAKFDVDNNNLKDYDIFFKINNNNTLTINKVIIKYNFRNEEQKFYCQLDTLININNKNKYIDIYKLKKVTQKEKNFRKNNY
ncbi:hypothetical protein [Psychroserpens sp. NJDZ02]|uniref:hypothetical protein n=1 Tax=Psychroserpens sp. NJDZ02 TaxID=2570561 RepID=UPI0010A8FB45|nr:hypothetical protein [Psychroserpens sp. NJDZ02]QCE40216.1 hypothetical protein E9099_01850 [Psychroserpens sp. NJDZ02]